MPIRGAEPEPERRAAVSLPERLPAEAPEPGNPAVLVTLRRHVPTLTLLAIIGGAAAGGVAALRPPSYRAVARLLVSEPRLGGPGSVDFNLTPIRSYTALVTSPSLVERCAASCGVPASAARRGLRARVPENTRVLELTFEGRDPARAAALVNCVATAAVDENRRWNAELASRFGASLDAAVTGARSGVEALERQLAETRDGARERSTEGALDSALGELEATARAERQARLRLSEAAARRRSWAERPAAGREVDEAAAEEAGARAVAEEAARRHGEAARRAAALDREIAAAEGRVQAARRRLDVATGALSELERRRAVSVIEAGGRGFELVPVAPASPPDAPAGAPALAYAALGALAAAAVFALLVLSRP